MGQTRHNQVKTQRGFTYSYSASPAASGKPTLLFVHGFPAGSFLWRRQVPFFQQLGYGLIVPDLLGYGETDKPTDLTVYVGSGHAQDLVDILDAERVEQVVAIGHDWYVNGTTEKKPTNSSRLVFKGSHARVAPDQLPSRTHCCVLFPRRGLCPSARAGL
jgi:pimeloyl-ACP methyl ester carboxylesterase